ncbi:MAG TPA: SusC/RagA family TonB-linked outer membrane protein [Chitinophaga sp.]
MRYWYYNICLIGVACLLALPHTTRAFQSAQDTTTKSMAHPGWANGTVVNEFNEPLPGVKVGVKNKAAAVFTDKNGHFEIDAPAGATLVFSYKDYYARELPVKAGTALDVQLTDAFLRSPQQVNMLYERVDRSRVLGAVSTIYTNQLTTTPASLYVYAFPGQMSGVYTKQNSGFTSFNVNEISSPEVIGQTLVNASSNNNRSTDNSEIALSVRGQTPITVIDGVQREISSIDPESIESISVLKDGFSTLLLGNNSSHPVVLVTTRRGELGRPRISFTAQSGVQQSLGLPKPLPAYQYAYLLNETLANDGKPPLYSEEDFNAYRQHTDPVGHPDVNWFNTLLRKSSPISNYKLNVNGGTNVARYSVSLSYFDQEGIFKTSPDITYNTNNSLKRYIINSDIGVQVNKNLNVDLQLFGRVQNAREPGNDYNALLSALYSTPNNAYPIYNPNGTFGGNNIGGNNGPYSNNLLSRAQYSGYTQNNTNDILANVDLHYNLNSVLPGLSAKLKGNLSYQSITALDRSLQNPSYGLINNEYLIYGATVAQNNKFRTVFTSRQSFGQFSLNYDRHFNKSNVTAQALYDVKSIVANYDLASTTTNIGARAGYDYENKYFVNATLIGSKNNRYPPGGQWGLFYGAGLGWEMGRESFIKDNISWISGWKWRATYARTGNANIDLNSALYYAYSQTYSSNNNNKNYQVGTSYTNVYYQYEGTLANPYITWEKGDKLDIGTDISFLHDRLQLTADYYHDRYSDVLGFRGNSIALLGTAYPLENIGKNLYQGIELSLTYNNHAGNFNYFVTANGSLAYSKILYNDELATPYAWNSRTGLPVSGTFYGYTALGLYQDAHDAATSAHIAGYTPSPGDIKYKDLNGDGVIDYFDQSTIGGRKPLAFYGVTLGANYKGFNFSVIIQGVANRQISVENNVIDHFGLDYSTTNGQAYASATGRWTPETADRATLSRLAVSAANNNSLFSTFYLKNGNYVRLRNAELGYSLPYSLLKRIRISGLKIFLDGENLFTIAGFKGMDPEVMPNSYPIQRVVTAGVNIKL